MSTEKPRSWKSVPGSIVYTGKRGGTDVPVHYLRYNEQSIEQDLYHSQTDVVLAPEDDDCVDWYDVRGMHDTELIAMIGSAYTIHPLVLEDVADIHQRPKYEEAERGVFISLRALNAQGEGDDFEIKTEQVAIYFRPGLIISFQETDSDLFTEVRERLLASSGRIRSRQSDYLAYALVDAVVDAYFPLLDVVEVNIDSIEDQLLKDPESRLKSAIHHQKRELLHARKSIAPLREAISRFARSESEYISEETAPFLRDLYDHTIHVTDTVDSYRDILNGLHDLFISEVSFKMNQVMQVLTVISVIFIPITFLAGIYGMNFEHIPELGHKNGYFIFWGVILLISFVQLYIFRLKKWL